MKVTGYAKVSEIRCLWCVAACHGSGYWAKKNISQRYRSQWFYTWILHEN